MMFHGTKQYINRGATLVELLIALQISLLMIAVTITAYLQLKDLYLRQLGMHQIMQSAMVAMLTLSEEIGGVGYAGCLKLSPDAPLDPKQTIQTTMMTPDTDKLTIKRFVRVGEWREGKIIWTHHIKPGEPIWLVDCARIAMRTNIPTDMRLADAMRVVTESFYTKPTGRKNNIQQPIYGLYIAYPDGTEEELVSGVLAMKLFYKQRGLENFYTASQIADGSSVVAVRVQLRLQSLQAVVKLNDQLSPIEKTIHFDVLLKNRL